MELSPSEAKYIVGALLLAERAGWQNSAGEPLRDKLAHYVFGGTAEHIDTHDAEGCLNEGANEILGRDTLTYSKGIGSGAVHSRTE